MTTSRLHLRGGFRERLDRRARVVAGGGRARGLARQRGRYLENKYDHVFVVEPASKAKKLIEYVHRILKQERDIVIASRAPEATQLHVENSRWTFVFDESGLATNVLYTLDDKKKRAVGFKPSDGMRSRPSSRASSSRNRSPSSPARSAARTS